MKVQITGKIEGLKEDLHNENKAIKERVNYSLTNMSVEMARELQATLQREWYRKYTPLVYKRRTDNNSLGTPIGADENFGYTNTDIAKSILEFVYNPTGEHKNREWHTRDSDDLISWIQNEHNYADIETGEIDLKIPARPFWNLFLQEQENGGIMEKFIKGMLPEYQVIQETKDKIDLSDSYLPENEIEVKGH